MFPPEDAPELPRPQAELSAPAASAPPAPGTPPDTEFAALDTLHDAAPQFDIVRVTDLGNVLVAGKAPPRVQVAALIDEAQIADTVSSGAGEFVMMFDVDPSRTPRVLELEIRLPQGGRVRSADTLMLAPSSTAASGLAREGQGHDRACGGNTPIVRGPIQSGAGLRCRPRRSAGRPMVPPARVDLPDAMTRQQPPSRWTRTRPARLCPMRHGGYAPPRRFAPIWPSMPGP